MPLIGCGPGGCGLASFAWFLNQQPGVEVTKERHSDFVCWSGALPFERYLLSRLIADERKRGLVLAGDVAFYHVPYVWPLFTTSDTAKFLFVFPRSNEEAAENLADSFGHRNPLVEDGSVKGPLSVLFPNVGVDDPLEAAKIYVELSTAIMHRLSSVLDPDRLTICSTETLDDEEGQNTLLTALGLPLDGRRLFPSGVDVHRSNH